MHQATVYAPYVAEIDLRSLGYLQFPEFFALRTPVSGGGYTRNWDQPLDDATVCWSSRYEPDASAKTGFLPLRNYRFYQALHQRFVRNSCWTETVWYQWIRQHRPLRYETDADIRARLAMLDAMYRDFRTGGPSAALSSLPVVNIGGGNRISIDDGRHRLCVAKLAGIRQMTVRVHAVHPDALVRFPRSPNASLTSIVERFSRLAAVPRALLAERRGIKRA